ncbi:4-hydroxybenzoate octaprenyltransferase [Cochlodiniinecator piscidefendens]|uniref:4-hydroxybenzoate octaprenyltransferase n=1 Tax=Cochlodiniinecator piscidefendens TaxID=2715756 RepID=UPI00140BFB41|nr:4-hydroxybenzoate octaprenyltransferase [Cochlodiniinecator piscidefendens]
MRDPQKTPEVKGQVKDAYFKNWVDHRAPEWSRPYLRLSRADRPIGTWLLLLPCWWAIMLAAATDGFRAFDLWIIMGCAIGAFVMRGAGCTWNDITDRDIDAAVDRTRSRPLPSGQVTVKQATLWMGIQALVGLAVLLTFNTNAIVLGFLAVIPVLVYPFAKRFTWWPQAFLGIAFNWGALLAWTAHRGQLEWPAIWLYAAGIVWTLFYDTIYAHQDKEDDALIGVKSTARLFGNNTHRWLRYFMMATVTFMAIAAITALGDENVLGLTLALGAPWALGWHLVWQLRNLDIDDTAKCLSLFRANRDAGLIPVLFFAVAAIL